jgi:hypothetical protein
VLTSIVTLDPIHFIFDGSEADFIRYLRLAKAGTRPSSRDVQNPVAVRLADEADYKHMGQMDFVDNIVNPRTGTIRGRAIFDNKDGLLTPGFFGPPHPRVERHASHSAGVRAYGDDDGAASVCAGFQGCGIGIGGRGGLPDSSGIHHEEASRARWRSSAHALAARCRIKQRALIAGVGDLRAPHIGERRQPVFLGLGAAHDFICGDAADQKRVGNE